MGRASVALLLTASVGCQTFFQAAAAPSALAAVTSPHANAVEPLRAVPPPAGDAATTFSAAGHAVVTPAADSATPRHLGPFAEPDEQGALQQVLPELQRLSQTDPALHAEVLKQLADTKPSLWPLTVQRAASTAAYKQQLAGRTTPAAAPVSTPNPYAAANPVAPPTTPPPAAQTASAGASSPAAPIAPAAQGFRPPPVAAQHAASQAFVASSAAPPAQRTVGASVPQPLPQVIENQHASAAGGTATVRLASATAGESAPRFEPQASVEPASAPPAAKTWRDHLTAAIAGLESELPASPRSTDEAYRHVRLRLMQLAAGREGDAVSPPPGLPTTEQGYWSKQLFAMATLLDTTAQPERSRRASAASHHQAAASDRVRQLGSLQVKNLTFCDEVYGFGAYEPIDEPAFKAGDVVSLYAEVENYRSESTERGLRTSLATSYRVVDRHGTLVQDGEFPVVEDHCLSPRRDFHIQYSVTLPTTVYPGEYRLELTITDQLGGKIGDDAIAFRIAAE